MYGRIVNVEFPVRVGDAYGMLRQTADARDAIDLVSGNLGHHIRQVSLQAIKRATPAAVGSRPGDYRRRASDMGGMLVGVARRVAGDVADAIVSVDPSLWMFVISDWQPDHGGENADVVPPGR